MTIPFTSTAILIRVMMRYRLVDENSLTPFAGEDGELSMPAGFYWDSILFIILGVVGLIGSLFTQLSLVPAWRARVKAMRDNEADKEEVAQALTDSDEIVESEGDAVTMSQTMTSQRMMIQMT